MDTQQLQQQECTLGAVKPPLSPGGSAFSSLENLAELAVCPIHCGRLNRPKLLPCGHVFCLTCLDKWSQRRSDGRTIECPMCRSAVASPPAGAAGLPTSHAHQAILDYLVNHAARRELKRNQQQEKHPTQNQTPQSVSHKIRSLEMRQDLLTQLTEDFLRRSESSESADAPKFDVTELAGVRDNLNKLLQRLEEPNGETVVTEEIESDVDSDSADEENETDEDDAQVRRAALDAFSATQREMHRQSRYRTRELLLAASPELAAERVACASLIRSEFNGQAGRIAPLVVLLTEASRQLLVTRWPDRRSRMNPTPLKIDWQIGDASTPRMRVISMQAIKGVIYLSGWQGCTSVLAIVKPEDSAVLRCHAREEPTESAAAEGFAGFHVEPSADADIGGVVAAQPGKRRVEFFGEDLQPTGHWLLFDQLKPRFVAWDRRGGTLWVSCPDDRLVLAVNDRTGVFRKLSTGDLFHSPPRHIVAAVTPDGDCRVILSDSEQGRLYWIRKRHKYIFLQRLQLARELPSVTGLSAAENGHLLVTTRDRVFHVKPRRPSSANQFSARCDLL